MTEHGGGRGPRFGEAKVPEKYVVEPDVIPTNPLLGELSILGQLWGKERLCHRGPAALLYQASLKELVRETGISQLTQRKKSSRGQQTIWTYIEHPWLADVRGQPRTELSQLLAQAMRNHWPQETEDHLRCTNKICEEEPKNIRGEKLLETRELSACQR